MKSIKRAMSFIAVSGIALSGVAALAAGPAAASNVVKGSVSLSSGAYIDLATGTGAVDDVGIGTTTGGPTPNTQCELVPLANTYTGGTGGAGGSFNNANCYFNPLGQTPSVGVDTPGVLDTIGLDGSFIPLAVTQPGATCAVVVTASAVATTFDKLTTPGTMVLTTQSASSNAVTGIETLTITTDTVIHPATATVAAPSTTKTIIAVANPTSTKSVLTLSPVKISLTKPIFGTTGGLNPGDCHAPLTSGGDYNGALTMTWWHCQPGINPSPVASKGDKLIVTVSALTAGGVVTLNNVVAKTAAAKYTDQSAGTPVADIGLVASGMSTRGYKQGTCKLDSVDDPGKLLVKCAGYLLIQNGVTHVPLYVYSRGTSGLAFDPNGLLALITAGHGLQQVMQVTF